MDFILKLKEERNALSDDLDPIYILPSLHRSKVITDRENKSIESKATKQERFNELFSLLTNGSRTFSQLKGFVQELEEEDEERCLPYPWLAEMLKPALKLGNDVHKILVRGNVPLPVNHLLPREKEIQIIRDKLNKVCSSENQANWVVVHGPIGSGKSSLAAEVLRSDHLIKNHFSHGVFWLDFNGNKNVRSNIVEVNKKIVYILKLLNSNYEFSPDDDLTYLLRNETFSKQILFILDEVCDKSVIRIFNIGCPILVTTTMKTIMSDVSSYCEFVECSNNVKDCDIQWLLSKYVNCKVEELPEVAHEICSKCGGSILVASLIGGAMADIGNDEETWKDWNKKLQENGLADLKNIEDVFNVIVNCIENNDDWKKYYCDLVIFKKGSYVPSEVLEIMWDTPAVLNIAVELYKRSFIVIKESESGSKFFCCSHDLYVDAVGKKLGEEEIKKLHKKFVNKIIARFPEETIDLTKLPKCYMPFFIDYHLYQAGNFKLLEKLYLDLKFVEHKIRLMNDCKSILVDYQHYKSCFENKEDAECFESFLQRTGKYLLSEENCDIIQLALFEPSNSIVYKKAKEYAEKKKGIYYDWSNKTKDIHKFFDYETYSCSNVKFGAINQDASLVAFGFESEDILRMKVRHLPTGKDVLDYSHKHAINYCAFNSTGDYLATAFAEIIEIFKIPSINIETFQDASRLLLTFDQHQFEVVCCCFAPKDNCVLSSDITGKFLVWRFDVDGNRPPIVILELSHPHDNKKEPLRFSSFSNNGKMIGTAVCNTVKLWDYKTKNKKKDICLEKDSIIKQFIFTNDDSHILLVMEKKIVFWDIENDKGQTVYSDSSDISSCCLSSSNLYIACGMKSGCIIIITKEGQKSLPGHNKEILNVMFSKDETKLFSISQTCFIIHNVSVMETIPFINGNFSVALNKELIIASKRTSYSVEVRKEDVVINSISEDEQISAFSLSNDGSNIVIGTIHGSVKVYNIIDKHSVELLPKHSGRINNILHSQSNHSFFTCSVDAVINVWRSNKHHVTLPGPKLPIVMCVEFKTCDKLLSCYEDGSLRIWNTDAGKPICILKGPCDESITCCDVSRDDKYVSAGFTNGNIVVWNAENGKLFNEFSVEKVNHNDRVNVRCCQFTPNTEMLIVGLDNGNVVLCHLLCSSTYYVIGKHESAVSCVTMINDVDRSDELYFLSASKSIKLWDNFGKHLQTILFPNATMADELPEIRALNDLEIFIVKLNSILYILKRIPCSQMID